VTPLGGWENFYVIVGSSAGALIGLQFVVLTLIAERPIVHDFQRASSAFSTPTIVHFSGVLLLSALASVPWHGTGTVAVLWGLLGVGGCAYEIVVFRRMRVQTAYKPVFEDWAFHLLLPLVAYGTLAVTAFANIGTALFAVAGAALLLLFVGIHNAWDAVTYHLANVKKEPSR
jgi:hypothetical protein